MTEAETIEGSQELVVLPKLDLPVRQLPTPKLKRANTLWNLWHEFVASHGPISPRTEAHYRYIGRRFIKFMRGKDLSAQAIMEWSVYLRTNAMPQRSGPAKGRPIFLSPTRINQINCRIRPFLRFLHRLGFIQTPLWELAPAIQEPERPPGKIITEEEYEKLKAHMAGKDSCVTLLWLCVLAYRTGMSLIDCCYLRWKDVTLNEDGPSFIDIYRRKTRRLGEKALCQIPVVPGTDLHQWLLRLRKVENYKRFDGIQDYVNQDAPGYYENTMWAARKDVKRVFQKVGIYDRSFKNFRNSLCSNLVNSGAQLALICKITGHNNVKTLLRYLNADRDALEDAMLKAYQYGETKK